MMNSLAMLGVLIAVIGAFIAIAGRDTRHQRRRWSTVNILSCALIAAGVLLSFVGVFR